MIGLLPESLLIEGIEHPIYTDYRDCIPILQAYGAPELSNEEKIIATLKIYYEFPDNWREAYEQAVWFLDCGNQYKNSKPQKKLIDWEQDEQYIFAAINKNTGYSIREIEYMHWWDFYGHFMEVGECVYTHILSLRSKKSKGKKLSKDEQEFYNNNRDIIDLRQPDIAKTLEEIRLDEAFEQLKTERSQGI